ncbi:hypothetical protein [Vibrio algivorus]|uniref:Uncharacterized protein n=1 Tax=Vibrio algivorus TaxID=1667024 RepID=A0ABQ6EMT8_9VIBR|nr:hypothetical protein [Vibrio algivorus]GLT14438.1 hypothetical protein GCM10007931_14130 [Vibrio algivorus]
MKIMYSGVIASHGEVFANQLKDFLIKNQDKIERQLIPNLDYIDPRALNDNGIQIMEVTYLGEARYSLAYQYDWFVFSPCTNIDLTGTDKNKVTLTVLDCGELEFDLSALGH